MPLNVYRFYDWISPRFRKRRLDRFVNTFQLTEKTRILDVGGYPEFWLDLLIPAQITLLNLDAPKAIKPLRNNFTYIQGDGRKLEFGDNEFHIAFSNSVIEHVGGLPDQTRFAQEIRRVARNVWVQTPNASFPIEPHFIGLAHPSIPRDLQRFLLRHFSVRGLLRGRDHVDFDELFDEVRLLSHAEMSMLFPDCTILRETLCGLTKSFVAVRQSAAR